MDEAMSLESSKDGATSTGKSFFIKLQLKLTITKKTPRMIIVIKNKNLETPSFELVLFISISLFFEFKLSKTIRVAIPAIATTQSTHQLRAMRTNTASPMLILYKSKYGFHGILDLYKKGKTTAANTPREFEVPKVLKCFKEANSNIGILRYLNTPIPNMFKTP